MPGGEKVTAVSCYFTPLKKEIVSECDTDDIEILLNFELANVGVISDSTRQLKCSPLT